jgi:hypothetical protein
MFKVKIGPTTILATLQGLNHQTITSHDDKKWHYYTTIIVVWLSVDNFVHNVINSYNHLLTTSMISLNTRK